MRGMSTTSKTKSDNRKGKKPSNRKLATQPKDKNLQANQWQNTPQQNKMMEYWLTPGSSTFGNAYLSALEAGYNPSYALKISAPSTNNKWLSEYRNQADFNENHIRKLLQSIATSKNLNSKSPADTQVKALEVLSKILGLTDNKVQVNNIQMTPILGGQTTPRKDVKVNYSAPQT